MGKKLKLREAQRREAEHAIAARLRKHSGTKTGPAFIGCYSEFGPQYRSKIDAYRELALRDPEGWRCRLRVRSPERRFLDLVRFTFAKFPVCHHLEQVWIDGECAAADQFGAPDGRAEGQGIPDFRSWYIAVAQGRSLHKEEAHHYMSRLESHCFVGAPREVSSVQRAFWYAFARAQTADTATALRVARTKLVDFPVLSSFWKPRSALLCPESDLDSGDERPNRFLPGREAGRR